MLLAFPEVAFDRADGDGCTSLMYAVQAGQYDVVKQLLGTEKVNIATCNGNGKSAMGIDEVQDSGVIMLLLLGYR
jgi:ankyrin repeat protein